MNLTLRKYQTEEDNWRIRNFLRQVYLLNGRRDFSWQVFRWDYWHWHGLKNLVKTSLDQVVHLWETRGGQIAAVLNPESRGEAFLQVHPDYRSLQLEQEMVETAEKNLASPRENGERELTIWVQKNDSMRQQTLEKRGYQRGEWVEAQRRRSMSMPVPDCPPPTGYALRSLGDGAELLERCYASGLAFHKGDIQIAADNRADVTWYRNIQNAPLYRRDFDIVAIAPDGAVASFCTVWFDDVTLTGSFEPVATVPSHQRRGLGKAVMAEGLRRLHKIGATQATVGSYEEPAHTLYATMGFTDYDLCESWIRRW